MQSEQQSTLNMLEHQPPSAWLAYLRQLESGEAVGRISMQVAFDFAAMLAKSKGDLAWAQVAVAAAEYEARHHNGVEGEEATEWAMGLRAWFIARMGSTPRHSVLDRELVTRWAEASLTIPLIVAEVTAKTLWPRLNRQDPALGAEELKMLGDELRRLRRIKNRLSIVKVLADSGRLPDDSRLQQWLPIREILP